MFNLKQYRENEDNNRHTENYLALARKFGTDKDIDFVERVIKVRASRGFLYLIESETLNSQIGKYYKLLIKEVA
jgi:HD superfamily phosphodiesterase